ncbi:tetratricopeptide repeat protein [Spirochaeta cellobiosiphila]|uniref:tetratricopeptide repeat protein n=1 Tax=Spirochaeta cellobiosiphila TaxID=504483 RepID=UPI0004219C52|nr:tetratricopeptide repeat protein [Spirochaeta cellobiosiphila]
MSPLIGFVIVFGVAIGFFVAYIVKSLIAPKRISTLADLIKSGKTASAARIAKQIIAKEPRSLDAHYFLGKAYQMENKNELALMEYKTVNSIGNFDGMCDEKKFRNEIATLFQKFNQHEEALKEYLLLIKLEPHESEHFYNAGVLFEERNRGDKAVGYYKKALEINPRHSDSHFRLGLILYRNQRSMEAKNAFTEALKYNRENGQAHFYLGRIAKERQEYTAALKCFESSQKDPDLKIKSLIERGSCYLSIETPEKAISELERAIKLATDPKANETLYARYFLSLAYEKTRKFDEAIEQWEKIYGVKPNFKDVSQKLSSYQDLRVDDQMKDYLTAGKEHFMELCKNAVVKMGLVVQDIKEIPNGSQIIAIEGDSAKWRNTRKMPKLIRFLRIPDMIEENIIRDLHEEMKSLGANRAIIFSSSNFSRMAITFAESRPVDLMNKDKLQNYLK